MSNTTGKIIIGLIVFIVVIILVVGVLMLPIYDCKIYPNTPSAFTVPGGDDEGPQPVYNWNLLMDSLSKYADPLYIPSSINLQGNTKEELFQKIDQNIPADYTVSQYGYVVAGKNEPIYLTYNMRKFYKMWASYFFDDLKMTLNFTANIPFKIKKSIIGNIYTVE
jgi:hypothetical protein